MVYVDVRTKSDYFWWWIAVEKVFIPSTDGESKLMEFFASWFVYYN